METQKHLAPTITRRRVLGLIGAAAVSGIYYFGFHRTARKEKVQHSMKMMGTFVNFTIITDRPQESREALQQAIAHMQEVGSAINWYNPSSPLSILNREGRLANAPATLITVVTMAKQMSSLTKGAFDPTVLPLLSLYKELKKTGHLPSEEEVVKLLSLVNYQNVEIQGTTIRYKQPGMGMTLDGIGKGYVVDQGVRRLNELGYGDVCIEAGGDLMVTGEKADGSPWTIGIRNPRPEQEEQFIVTLKNRAIATSGDYEQDFTKDHRYHHIINPFTGFSPPELASASIIAPTVAEADGLATAAIVMGHEKTIKLLETLAEHEGFLIGKDLSTYSSTNFFGRT